MYSLTRFDCMFSQSEGYAIKSVPQPVLVHSCIILAFIFDVGLISHLGCVRETPKQIMSWKYTFGFCKKPF